MNDGKATSRAEFLRAAMDRYGNSLARYAAQILGDADRASDVVQDTFVRLCSEDLARVDGHLAEWLFTVCRNRAVDVRRKEDRMFPMTEAVADAQMARDESPPVVLETREGAGRVMQLLSLLPENQREVIRLKFQNGLSYREISAITALSVSNVGFLIHTAIRTLRAQMGE